MKQVVIEHRFPISADHYLQMLLNPDFDNALMSHIRVAKQLLSKQDTPDGFIERTQCTPQRDLPSGLARVTKGFESYVEVRNWNLKNRLNNWHEEIPVMADRVKIHGTFEIREDGPDACRRIVIANFDIKVPLIGGQIEAFLADELQKTFVKIKDFCDSYIAQKGQTA